jgi:hypothetical protein
MRERGLRPVQLWVPDVRTKAFAAQAYRQASLVARADEGADDQEFVEAISVPWDEVHGWCSRLATRAYILNHDSVYT